MKQAWKLFRLRKDGTLGSLFINRKQIIAPGQWLMAGRYPTKRFAFRPGWHVTKEQNAPHLKKEGRVWQRVLIDQYEELKRPESQGGVWYLAKWMKVL